MVAKRTESHPPFFGIVVLACLLAAAPSSTEAESDKTSAPAASATDAAGEDLYKPLRYEEDWRTIVRDPKHQPDPWDRIKYIPLSESDENIYLTLGGEVRERYERFHNPAFGAEPDDPSGYGLLRHMLHADLHASESIRLFAQVQSDIETGRRGGPRPETDEDQFDLHQGFGDWVLPFEEKDKLTIRIGRQEMQFGSQRLVSVREGPNVRRSFDGARILYQAEHWKIDGFLTKPVAVDVGALDNDPDPGQSFWGIYGVNPIGESLNTDLYYLGLEREDAEFAQGTAYELRHSVGTRIWGKAKEWDYNLEFVYQFGKFGSGIINAWTAASDISYTFESLAWQPQVGLRANVASGDRDEHNANLQTFNPLFPKGAYFNQADLVGPSNFYDVHPTVSLHPSEKVTITADWLFFWRLSTEDGLYNTPANLVRGPMGSDARYVGSSPTVQAEWQVTQHLAFTAYYSHFFSGPFIEETGPGGDVDYVSAWGTYKF